MSSLIYLDNAASTPCDPRVIEEILPYLFENFANPSNTTNSMGKFANHAIESARSKVGCMLNCLPQKIIWTSGATEANNIAIQGVLKKYRKKKPTSKPHIIVSSIEHKSVLETVKSLSNIEISFIEPDSNGITHFEDFENSITSNTFFASIMFANNELGTINDIVKFSEICQRRGVLFHTDATQIVGKIPIDVTKLKIDFLSFSGHKIYAPKGVGALFVKDFSALSPINLGGGHENGFRPGTLNVSGIVGMGKACDLCSENQKDEYHRINQLRDYFEKELVKLNDKIIINGINSIRVPNISNITFPVKRGYNIIKYFDFIACSSGSACDTPDNTHSHVLNRIGKSMHEAKNTIRFSLGRFTTEKEINLALNHIMNVIKTENLLN